MKWAESLGLRFGLEGSIFIVSELLGIGIVMFRVSVVYLRLKDFYTGISGAEMKEKSWMENMR